MPRRRISPEVDVLAETREHLGSDGADTGRAWIGTNRILWVNVLFIPSNLGFRRGSYRRPRPRRSWEE